MQRRHFLLHSLAGAALLPARGLRAQDSCGALTPPNIEGPFYRPGAPERTRIAEPGSPDAIREGDPRPLVLSGRVRTSTCDPAAGAVIEVWQADEHGAYDLQGFRHRGVVRCSHDGAYSFQTIRPGRYRVRGGYRPAHIHVKVHGNGRPPLTTQIYFGGDPYNERDPWFDRALVARHAPQGCSAPNRTRPVHMYFDFVI